MTSSYVLLLSLLVGGFSMVCMIGLHFMISQTVLWIRSKIEPLHDWLEMACDCPVCRFREEMAKKPLPEATATFKRSKGRQHE